MARKDGQDTTRDMTQRAFDSYGNSVDLRNIRAEDRVRLLGDM